MPRSAVRSNILLYESCALEMERGWLYVVIPYTSESSATEALSIMLDRAFRYVTEAWKARLLNQAVALVPSVSSLNDQPPNL